MTNEMEGQVSLFDQGSAYGRTCTEACQVTEEGTSRESSRNLRGSQTKNVPMFLCLRREDGASQESSNPRWESGALRGDLSTRNFGEYPYTLMAECLISEPHNGVSVSLLSQILEERVPEKYYLSERACVGILRRANKRGKKLPSALEAALMEQVNRTHSKSEGGLNETDMESEQEREH